MVGVFSSLLTEPLALVLGALGSSDVMVVHGEDGLLRSVAVDEDYRGQGLAASLVEAAMQRARRLNLRAVYLLTTGARDYFARRGFADCPRDDAPAAAPQEEKKDNEN